MVAHGVGRKGVGGWVDGEGVADWVRIRSSWLRIGAGFEAQTPPPTPHPQFAPLMSDR